MSVPRVELHRRPGTIRARARQREGPADEAQVAFLVQAVGQVCVAGRLSRDFAAAAEVDAVQDARAAAVVDKRASLGGDGHGLSCLMNTDVRIKLAEYTRILYGTLSAVYYS